MGVKIITKNKRASYDYFLHEKYEAGLSLTGTEVKSLRNGKASIGEAYVTLDKKGEVWVYNMLIPQYEFGNITNHQENRKRKLLLHRDEIAKISLSQKQNGYTIVPTSLYFKKSRVKLEFALAKGKKNYDKRESKAKQEVAKKIRKGDYS